VGGGATGRPGSDAAQHDDLAAILARHLALPVRGAEEQKQQ